MASIFLGVSQRYDSLILKNFTQSKFSISLILAIPGLAGCIVPPVVGYFSDRCHTRFGRRKPFVFCGMLGTSIFIIGLQFTHSFFIVAIISAVMYFVIRIAETPFLSLLPDIAPPEQRSTASGTMNFFGSIGLIVFFVIGSQIWDSSPGAVFYMVAFVCFLALTTAVVLIKEPAVTIANSQPKEGSLKGKVQNYVKGVLKETTVMKFFIAQFFWWLGFWMISSFLTLFVVEELHVAEGKSFLVPMIFSVISTLFMLPMGIMGDRMGRKGIITCMILFWSITGALIGLCHNLMQTLILVAITGIPYAAVIGIGYAYMLDLIPDDRTAEFVGFSVISVALAQIFGPLIGGRLIDIMGYRPLFPSAALFMITGLVILQFVRVEKKVTSNNELDI